MGDVLKLKRFGDVYSRAVTMGKIAVVSRMIATRLIKHSKVRPLATQFLHADGGPRSSRSPPYVDRRARFEHFWTICSRQ
jgi:hypothetical protein